MLQPIQGSQFRRDVKLAQKRKKDMSKLRDAISILTEQRPLPAKYKDHPLSGDWVRSRECHLETDWLLIYKIDANDLHLIRTGSHSDLF